MTLCYGTCDGGPYHGKRLAHGEPSMQLAYERHRPAMALPCLQASADPEVAFGGYLFDQALAVWFWKAETLWKQRNAT